MDDTATVYKGGIPNQGFNGTYPDSAGAETMFKPDPTDGEIDTENGSPASGAGKSEDGGFVKGAGEAYEGSADLDPTGGMKVIDLDDIKNTV